jgi:hypothetical protein
LAIIYGFLGGKYFFKSFCATIILVSLSSAMFFLAFSYVIPTTEPSESLLHKNLNGPGLKLEMDMK